MEEMRSEVKQEKRVANKDLMKVWWRRVFFQEANISYERLRAPGFFYAVSPILVKLYGDNPEELTAACKRYVQFCDSEPYYDLAIYSITLALGEERANGAPISDKTIGSLETGLIRPLAGLGDSARAGTIAPIVTAFCISIGQTGSLVASLLLEGILVVIVWPFAVQLLRKSYHTGKEDIQEIFSNDKLNWITTMISTLGGIILGALTVSYVTLSSPLEFVLKKGSKIALQADVLDVILKSILPLSMVLLSVYLLNKKVSAIKIMLILAAVCALSVLIGIF